MSPKFEQTALKKRRVPGRAPYRHLDRTAWGIHSHQETSCLSHLSQSLPTTPTMPEPSFDIAEVRSRFPALGDRGYIFADNAGGSQCLATVVARISDYLLHTNVQLGADYSASVSSTQRVKEGVDAARELFHAENAEEISLGSSSTMLIENLARAMESDFLGGEEIIVTGEHEGERLP